MRPLALFPPLIAILVAVAGWMGPVEAAVPGGGGRPGEMAPAQAKEALLDELTRAYRAGDNERVLHVLVDSLPPAECTARLWNLEGLALERAGRLQEAVTAYESGIRLRGDLWELHMNLGRSLEALGQGGRALAEFSRAVELAPRQAEARLALGTGYLRYHRFEQAREQLQEAARLDPHDPRILLERARLADAMEDRPRARELWRQVEGCAPSAESARRLAALSATDHPDSALIWYERCVSRDSSALDCAAAAGALLLQQGRPAEAVRWLRQAVEEAPQPDPAALHDLLLAWQRLAEPDSVEALVAVHPPTLASSWGVVALARRGAGRSGDALAAAQRAVELAPRDPDLLNILAVILYEEGQEQRARAIWRQVLEIAPDHPQARRNLAQ